MAAACSDEINSRALKLWASFITNEFPTTSYGSPGKVRLWCESRANRVAYPGVDRRNRA